MLDFTVQRFTRRCHQTERDLQPGETVYSVLIPQEAQVIRRDYSLEAWTGPPEDAIGWWRSKVEEGKDANAPPKVEQAPDEALWSYLHSLSDQPENEDVRYILALLLVRRRLARLENTENDEFGREILVIYHPQHDIEYRTPVAAPNSARAQQIQDDLARLLFGEADAGE